MKVLLLLLSLLLAGTAPAYAQGRDFDGTNDNLLTADNALAGLDVAQKSCGWWGRMDAAGGSPIFINALTGTANGRFWAFINNPTTSGWRLNFQQDTTTATGSWSSTADLTLGAVEHYAYTYDRSTMTTDPVAYRNGATEAMTEIATPTGTVETGEDTVRIGESLSGATDSNMVMQNFVCQVGTIWDAAAVNRARWWGRPHGGELFWYRFYSSQLTDSDGSGQATLTATGSIMTSLVTPAVRPGTAMLGLGVGW